MSKTQSEPQMHQAVVVIHGIGEQRPMDTLRSFVEGIKTILEEDIPLEKRSTVRSKPDSIGDIYETNRLSMDSIGGRPITDFYEFYWAHNMRDTELSHMFTWMYRLVFTTPGKVPKRLRRVYYTIWILLILTAAIAGLLSWGTTLLSVIKTILAPLLTLAIVPSLLSLAGSFFKSAFLRSAGDAARYFTPTPDNIGERSRIRQQGIEFLKKLHDIKKNSNASRIIIVAHSLGSVIAYDLLRLLWTEYNDQYGVLPTDGQPCLAAVDQFALQVKNKKEGDANLDIGQFQAAQFACWKEQRRLGNPWLVTDLVTLGAAVNAIDYFTVTNETIANLIIQRELPTCPPEPDHKDNSIAYVYPKPKKPEIPHIRRLHHGALFGVTRWTNIFYECDFVGGEMQRNFKEGIKDIPIPRRSAWIYPGGHTKYWDIKDDKHAIREIIEAMNLNDEG